MAHFFAIPDDGWFILGGEILDKNTNDILIAYCGLCCTNCIMSTKYGCRGCHSVRSMNRNCKIKECSSGRGYNTCAECKDFEDFKKCKKLNNFMSRFMGFVFDNDRIKNLKRLREIGLDSFKKEKIIDKKP